MNPLTPIEALKNIYRHLDNLQYERSGREYTLDEDAMGWIFYCRDTAWLAIKDEKK